MAGLTSTYFLLLTLLLTQEVNTHEQTPSHTYAHTYVTHILTHTDTHTHTYIYTHTHTYICIHKQATQVCGGSPCVFLVSFFMTRCLKTDSRFKHDEYVGGDECRIYVCVCVYI
jgi:hypothetical protein